MPDVKISKEKLRSEMRTLRLSIHQQIAKEAAIKAGTNFIDGIAIKSHDIIALYYPLNGELDCLPLLINLHKQGIATCLPAVVAKNEPLIFRTYAPDDPLIDCYAGTKAPLATVSEVSPTIVLVPLLAFDKAGNRLGYGGGFYDRTLRHLRQQRKILAIGFAYAAQKVGAVPFNTNDERLDAVVTEEGFYTFK